MRRWLTYLILAVFVAVPACAGAQAPQPQSGTTWRISAVAVGVTAIVLLPAAPARLSAECFHNGNVTVFLGPDATVASTTGFPFPPGTDKVLDRSPAAAVFAVGVAGTQDVRCIEELR